MEKKALKVSMMALAAGMALPLAAQATEADLQVRIDKLTKQMEELKGQVQKIEDKSLGKWLQISGDYRFRVDSLHGKTVAYTSAPRMFASAQSKLQADFFANPSTVAGTSTYFGAPQMGAMSTSGALTAMMNFANGMAAARTFSAAQAFVAANGGMIQGMGMAFGADGAVAAYKPKNETLYTNKLSLDLKAKATKDVTVNVKLGMYKVFGSQDDTATNGNAFFADRVGVFDGTLGHVPSDSYLNVDRAYATWTTSWTSRSGSRWDVAPPRMALPIT